jgi:hypothetical protein
MFVFAKSISMAGDPILVHFRPDPNTEIEIQTRIAQVYNLGFGLDITGIREDSLLNLCRLIMSKADDKNMIKDELLSRKEMIPPVYKGARSLRNRSV